MHNLTGKSGSSIRTIHVVGVLSFIITGQSLGDSLGGWWQWDIVVVVALQFNWSRRWWESAVVVLLVSFLCFTGFVEVEHLLKHDGSEEISGVLLDETGDEDTIGGKAVVYKVGWEETSFLLFGFEGWGSLEVAVDEVTSNALEHIHESPVDQRKYSENSNKEKPEPEEDVDFLGEHVDDDHTLDAMVVDGGEVHDREVTHGDTREDSGGLPFTASDEVLEGLESPHPALGFKEVGKNPELENDVSEVHDLDKKVEGWKEFSRSHNLSSLLEHWRLVTEDKLSEEVLPELSSFHLVIAHVRLDFTGSFGNSGEFFDFEFAALVEGSPDDRRKVEEEGLDEEDDGDPLVVSDLWSGSNSIIR